MKPFTVPAGSKVMLGAPAIPMQQDLSDGIHKLLAGIPGIREAHTPQCFVVGVMEAPAQVLVLVVDDATNCGDIISAVGEGLGSLFPAGKHLDVWPMDARNALLPAIRQAGMQIHGDNSPSGTKRWWKIFS